MRFWTADTHFGHENILRLGPGRPFRTIDAHDSALVDRWNAAVGPQDEVWHLGDVSMKLDAALEVLPFLNGRITIVAGNHDVFWSRSGRRRSGTERAVPLLLEAGVERVVTEGETTTAVDGQEVLVSHLPAAGDPYLGPYADRLPVPGRRPLVCGHVHHLWRTHGRQVNVGVDAWSYAPVPEDVLAATLRTLPGLRTGEVVVAPVPAPHAAG
jgi:calcineurin-like phosphoesterase family protein